MLLPRSCALLAAAASTAHAFKDSRPFLMLATEALNPETVHSSQVSTSSSLEDRIVESLSGCSADYIYIVDQPGLAANDYPKYLESRLKDYKTVVEIPEVLGDLEPWRLASGISSICGSGIGDILSGPSEVVSYWQQPERPGAPQILLAPRDAYLAFDAAHPGAFADALCASISGNSGKNVSQVLIIISSPSTTESHIEEDNNYDMADDEPPFHSIMHTNLKRDMPHLERRASNSTEDPQAGLPLFEKYQFLSPGIFMTLSVSLLLLSILYVGISAIANLEVSYAAFSKEMGPAAQNKGKTQ